MIDADCFVKQNCFNQGCPAIPGNTDFSIRKTLNCICKIRKPAVKQVFLNITYTKLIDWFGHYKYGKV